MTTESLLVLLVPLTYGVMLAIEARYPAREFPRVTGWHWVGALGLALLLGLGLTLPLLLPTAWLEEHRLLDATSLGTPLGVVVGYAMVSLMSSAWHWSLHRFAFLWRIHQLHHAPRRLDLSSATVFHPLDALMFGVVQSLAVVLVVGVTPLAAAMTGYVAMFYSLFQHWNVRTPRWLGWVIQRPEAHCEHHELGVHARNYSDFPPWDAVFGTRSNPSAFDGRVGFDGPAPLGKLLRLVDVHDDLPPPSSRPLDAAAE